MKKLILTFAAVASLSGCANVQSVSLTPIPANRNKVVKAEVSKTIFLGFNFNNDYVEPLVDDLKQQCPNGVVSGILTKDETIAYVIIFTRRIVATGFCNVTTASNSKAPKRSSASEGRTRSGLSAISSAIILARGRRARFCWLSARTCISHSTAGRPRSRPKARKDATPLASCWSRAATALRVVMA